MTISVIDAALYAGALFILFLTPGPVWVALAAQIRRALGQNKAPSRWIKRLGGSVLIALGLRLAFSQR